MELASATLRGDTARFGVSGWRELRRRERVWAPWERGRGGRKAPQAGAEDPGGAEFSVGECQGFYCGECT